jgi:YHS domain-containing protein
MVREPYTPWEYREGAEMAIEKDPVCGMEVDTDTSVLSTEHEGKTYWFCSRGCLLDFKDDPEKYLASDYQPTM